jgi:hypothetical protein
MSNAIGLSEQLVREAEELIARDARGEELTSAEWSALAVFHADKATRYASRAARWNVVSVAFALLALLVLIAGRLLA